MQTDQFEERELNGSGENEKRAPLPPDPEVQTASLGVVHLEAAL
jgi:hypothetical protein